MSSLAQLKIRAVAKLNNSNGVDARVANIEANALLKHVLGCNDLDLLLATDRQLSSATASWLEQLVHERCKGKPIAHQIGTREFYSLELECSAAALIPRPETELLVEKLEQLLPQDRPINLADFGSGSGAIACAIASLFPWATIDAFEIDPAAEDLARSNCQRWSEQITVIQQSWSSASDATYAAIVANPPYLTSKETMEAFAQGTLHDPAIALDGGDDGLDCFRELIPVAINALQPNGLLALEHGANQMVALLELIKTNGLLHPHAYNDLAGLPRIIIAQKTAD